MKPAQAIKTCLTKSFQFRGRASRSEYWWFFMATLLLSFLFMRVDIDVFQKDFWEPSVSFWPASDTFAFLSLLPLTTVGARRLQDISLPSWPALLVSLLFVLWITTEWGAPTEAPISNIAYVVMVLSFFLLVAAIFPSNPGPNKYGPNPHEVPS